MATVSISDISSAVYQGVGLGMVAGTSMSVIRIVDKGWKPKKLKKGNIYFKPKKWRY